MQRIHRQFSAECFNACWTIIEKQDRSDEDIENMLALAYASLWHWKQRDDCAPLNLNIAFWQISRVHALAGQAEMARWFGEKCLSSGLENNLPPFYIGYACEALARAALAGGDRIQAREWLDKAGRQTAEVADEEDWRQLQMDLDALSRTIGEQ